MINFSSITARFDNCHSKKQDHKENTTATKLFINPKPSPKQIFRA